MEGETGEMFRQMVSLHLFFKCKLVFFSRWRIIHDCFIGQVWKVHWQPINLHWILNTTYVLWLYFQSSLIVAYTECLFAVLYACKWITAKRIFCLFVHKQVIVWSLYLTQNIVLMSSRRRIRRKWFIWNTVPPQGMSVLSLSQTQWDTRMLQMFRTLSETTGWTEDPVRLFITTQGSTIRFLLLAFYSSFHLSLQHFSYSPTYINK